MAMTVDELKELHSMATSQRERAEVELEMWQRFGAELPPGTFGSRLEYLTRVLDVPAYDIDMRQRIIGIGAAAAPLWIRVEADLPMLTAMQLVRLVRKTQRPTESLEDAVARVLAEYDALPFTRRTKAGKVVRVGPMRGGQTVGREETRAAPKSTASRASAEHVFRTKMKDLVRSFVEDMLVGHTESNIVGEADRVISEVSVVLAAFTDRIGRKKRGPTFAEAITRPRLADACQTLHVDPPKPADTKSSQWFGKVKRQWKSLASTYHPDRAGTEATREQFQAVMEAWRVIELYMDQKEAPRGVATK